MDYTKYSSKFVEQFKTFKTMEINIRIQGYSIKIQKRKLLLLQTKTLPILSRIDPNLNYHYTSFLLEEIR